MERLEGRIVLTGGEFSSLGREKGQGVSGFLLRFGREKGQGSLDFEVKGWYLVVVSMENATFGGSKKGTVWESPVLEFAPNRRPTKSPSAPFQESWICSSLPKPFCQLPLFERVTCHPSKLLSIRCRVRAWAFTLLQIHIETTDSVETSPLQAPCSGDSSEAALRPCACGSQTTEALRQVFWKQKDPLKPINHMKVFNTW